MAYSEIMVPYSVSTDTNSHEHIAPDAGTVESRSGQEKSWNLAIDVMNRRIEKIDATICQWQEVLPFMVGDVGAIYRQRLRWKKMLPRVDAHYGKPLWPMQNIHQC